MDDIVKRIRQQSYFGLEPYEAADEIEQLRQRVAELEENWRLSEIASAKRQMNVIKLTAERDALKQQRDGLLKACKTYMSHGVCEVTYYAIRNAIASVKEK